VKQVTLVHQREARAPAVLVAVVDDQPSSADLRSLVASSFQSYAERTLHPTSGCAHYDPATLHPLDVSLLVVHPSASADTLVSSPADDPRLRWREAQPSEAGRSSWNDAVSAALTPTAPEGAPFAPLAALQRTLALLSGQRLPEGAAESALLESLPAERDVVPMLFAAHEDQSLGDPTDYVTLLPSDSAFDEVIVPRTDALSETPACAQSAGVATARFAAWLAAQKLSSSQRWPCASLTLLSPPQEACVARCLDWHPVKESDGRVDCRVLVEADVDHCDATLGWLDPLDDKGVRRPVSVTSATGVRAECEVLQLTGDALLSCQTSFTCPDCQPGWCATSVSELLDSCTLGSPEPFRFVGGADSMAPALVEITCNAEKPEP
jgi:hypothetical protein